MLKKRREKLKKPTLSGTRKKINDHDLFIIKELFKKEEFETAAHLSEKLLAKSFSHLILNELTRFYFEKGLYSDVVRLLTRHTNSLNKIINFSIAKKLFMLLAKAHRMQFQSARAIKILKKLFRRNKRDFNIRLEMALSYMQVQAYDKALEVVRRYQRANAYLVKGICYYGLSDFKKSLINFQKAHKLVPDTRLDEINYGLLKSLIHDNKIKLLKSKTIADLTNVERQTVTDSVALVIPAKNAGQDFESLLLKITNQELVKNLKIVVVNSGRKAGTAEIAKSFSATVVEILPQDFNHGETRNLGTQYATDCDYIVFMTQDSIPIGNYFLCDLINSFKLDPQIAAVTARQMPKSDADLFACWSMWHHYNFLKLFKTEILCSPNISTLPYPQKRRLSQLDDVCSAYKADIFAKNRFKKLKFAEDLDYGYRMVKQGHKLLYNHDVAVIHSHNRDAVYVLKRSYVDTNVLPEVLEYQPGCSNIPDLNYLLKEVNTFYNALKRAINKTNFSANDPLSVFKNHLLKQIDKPVVSLSKLNSSLDDIFSEIHSIYCFKDINYPLKKTNILIHSFLDCLEDFEQFISKRSLMGLEADVKSALFKIFANIAGASLGNYSYTNNEKHLDRVLFTADV